jgi:hypothetical protein
VIEIENSLKQIKSIMQTKPNWNDWLTNHTSNDADKRNMQAHINILSLTDLYFEKLRLLVEDIDTIILAADKTRNVMIFHSPKNYGGMRTRPKNKVVGMIRNPNQSTSNMGPNQPNLSSCKLQHSSPNCWQTRSLHNRSRSRSNPSPKLNRHRQLQRLSNFYSGPSSQECYTNVKYLKPL